VAGQLLQLQRILRERVWAAAHVGLKSITLDTDTTVHTLYGRQMGARKSYKPEKQRQEKLSAHSHFYGRNPRVRFGENCAMATGPMESRSRAICTVSSRPLPQMRRDDLSRGRMPAFIVGRAVAAYEKS